MADMYNSACTSSSSSPPEPDDFSLFLHQILLRSSQSSSQPNPPPNCPIPPSPLTIPETQIAGFGNVFSGAGAGYVQSTGHHSGGGAIVYDPEEYDCDDSEEGFEALAEGTPAARTAPSRGGSKRTRAAEVHNMSEKRRRSRINEKMKALQNLIPNSNKTDKASMLDEAIEYLKQLQLQVQMLTVKNGLSLYPMFHPGVLQSGQLERMKMDLYQGNGLLNAALALNKNIPENSHFNVPNQPTSKQFQPSGAALASVLNSDVPRTIRGHGAPFNQLLQVPSEEPLKDEAVAPPEKIPDNHYEAKPFGSVTCNSKENAVVTCIVGTERPESFFPSHLQCNPVFGSHLNDLCTEKKF